VGKPPSRSKTIKEADSNLTIKREEIERKKNGRKGGGTEGEEVLGCEKTGDRPLRQSLATLEKELDALR